MDSTISARKLEGASPCRSKDFSTRRSIYLAAGVIVVPVFKRLGLGSVLGYLVAGTAIGPWGLALVTAPEAILHFAEFGVVLLLFLVGLELNPKRVWQLRKPIFGMGAVQVLATIAVVALIGLGAGRRAQGGAGRRHGLRDVLDGDRPRLAAGKEPAAHARRPGELLGAAVPGPGRDSHSAVARFDAIQSKRKQS